MNKPEKDIQIITSKNVENKKYLEKRDRFLDILDDHPDFISGIRKIRKKFKIPENGFNKKEKSFIWLSENKETRPLFYKYINSLKNKFIIPNEIENSIEEYIERKVLIPKQFELPAKENRLLSKDSYPIITIVKTADGRDEDNQLINPSTSIEIFDWTTKRDLNEAWKIITAERKKIKKPFPKIKNLPRFVWHLSKKGLSTKEIRTEVKKIIKDDRYFGYEDVTKYKDKYNKMLKKIRNHT